MKLYALFLLFICSILGANAQQLAPAKAKKVVVTTDHALPVPPAVKQSAQKAVQTLGDKIKQGDFMYGLKTMYPRYKKRQEAMHGAKKFKEQFNRAGGELLKLGVTIQNFQAKGPTGFFHVWPKIKPEVKAKLASGEQKETKPGDEYYHWMVIVPTTQVWQFLSQNGGKPRFLKRDEFYIAIAKVAEVPGQEQWTFISSPIKEQQLRAMFPSLPDNLVLPKLLDSEIEKR